MERGMSQTELGGDEISAGSLSRLESGTRPPTTRIMNLLAQRLGVPNTAFDDTNEPDLATLLAEFHSTPRSLSGRTEAIQLALARDTLADTATRWQALWALAAEEAIRPDANPELATLASLVSVARQLGVAVLVSRAESLYSRWLRIRGRYEEAVEHARAAVESSDFDSLAVEDRALALLALIAAVGDLGHLSEARRHADDLLVLVAECDGPIVTEALWVNATVRMLQGDREGALGFLGRAVRGAEARDDFTLWLRTRLASASLHLQMDPPDTRGARNQISEVEPIIELLAEPRQIQEYHAIRAHLALAEHDIDGATRLATDLLEDDRSLLSHRDQVRLRAIEGRARILSGDQAGGIRQLRELADELGPGALATEIYRLVVETLDHSRSPAVTSDVGEAS
jgi:tetratricopeptide (TPR) repeat protein